jgi:hypothetical protein
MHCTAYGLSHGAISVLAENPQLRASLSSAVRQGVALVLITEANVFKIAARSNAALRPEFALAT